jgi:hypothetical protein
VSGPTEKRSALHCLGAPMTCQKSGRVSARSHRGNASSCTECMQTRYARKNALNASARAGDGAGLALMGCRVRSSIGDAMLTVLRRSGRSVACLATRRTKAEPRFCSRVQRNLSRPLPSRLLAPSAGFLVRVFVSVPSLSAPLAISCWCFLCASHPVVPAPRHVNQAWTGPLRSLSVPLLVSVCFSSNHRCSVLALARRPLDIALGFASGR